MRTKGWMGTMAMGVLAATLLVPVGISGQDDRSYADDFEWSGVVARGDALEIRGISGSVTAVRSSGNQVEVVARKSARRSDPESVSIEVIEHAGGVTLCALYPTPENAARENSCGAGDDDGSMNVNRNDTSVEWEVRMPAGVDFVVRNVNGEIDARGLESDIRARTVNGDVDIETTGAAMAETVNGSIHARFDRLTEDAHFETVNGSIELDVSDDLNAELDAAWMNGSLDSTLPISMMGRLSRQSARGEIGDGGPLLRLRTINGSIEIR